MLDYWKLWIYDVPTIHAVLNNKDIKKDFTYNEAGTLLSITGRYQGWKVKTLSPCLLEITGSIHKCWNGGYNENDFSINNAIEATQRFCLDFGLNPTLVHIKNLEFGINIRPQLNASDIIAQIVCFNHQPPIRPYSHKPDCFFVEFAQWDYYLKIYDKGKQYRSQLPETPNTLRLEAKAMNGRYLNRMGIYTLADLLYPVHLQVLGLKLAKILKGLVMDDDTLIVNELPPKDRAIYKKLNNPRMWQKNKGNSSSTIRNHESRFKLLVEQYGRRKIYSNVLRAVDEKLTILCQN